MFSAREYHIVAELAFESLLEQEIHQYTYFYVMQKILLLQNLHLSPRNVVILDY